MNESIRRSYGWTFPREDFEKIDEQLQSLHGKSLAELAHINPREAFKIFVGAYQHQLKGNNTISTEGIEESSRPDPDIDAFDVIISVWRKPRISEYLKNRVIRSFIDVDREPEDNLPQPVVSFSVMPVERSKRDDSLLAKHLELLGREAMSLPRDRYLF